MSDVWFIVHGAFDPPRFWRSFSGFCFQMPQSWVHIFLKYCFSLSETLSMWGLLIAVVGDDC